MTATLANTARKTAQANLRILAKIELARREMSVTDLARKLRLSRVAVSQAINHGIYGGVLAKVRRELGI